MTALDTTPETAPPIHERFAGPRLCVTTPGGSMDEPLRDDVAGQIERLVRCVQWLDPQSVTWEVRV